MRYMHLFILALILSAVTAFAADSHVVEPGITSNYNVVPLPVLKVFTANDGEHRFLAYLVKWKGAEVVVSDTLARSTYKVGDTVPVLVMKTSVDKKDGTKIHSLAFAIGRPDDK